MIAAGTIVDGRYEIISLLGEGGMSAVYKARHLEMQRDVALKILHSRLVTEGNAVERFRREAIAVNELRHPNIVKVYGFGVYDRAPYMAMEFLEGVSLAALLQQEQRLPAEKSMPIFHAILAGLEHAHCQGILHRDLKPSNVMLVGEERSVKLVDFGMAKILPETGKGMQKITQTGQLFGTVAYMSPEQCRGERLDVRSDIYSLGCLMYEVLDGEPPLRGDNAFATLNKHLTELPRSSQYLEPDLTNVILACLEKEPGKRPASASALLNAIRNPATFAIARRWNGTWLARPSKVSREKLVRIAAGVLVIGGLITAATVCISQCIDRGDKGVNQAIAQNHFVNGGKAARSLDHQLAIREYTLAIDCDPQFAAAYYKRGCEYSILGLPEKALHEFNIVIDDLKNPLTPTYDRHEPFQRRADTHCSLNQLQAAVADETAAIDLSPREGYLYRDRANLYIKLGRFRDAWLDIAQAEKHGKLPDPMVLQAKAKLYDLQGNHGQAYECWTEAIAIFAKAVSAEDRGSIDYALNCADLAFAYGARATEADLIGDKTQSTQDRVEEARWSVKR